MVGKPRNAAELLQISNNYWSACALHAGVKLDLFTPLSACPHSATDLADLIGCDSRALAMLLDALTAMGLLEKTGASYAAAACAAELLSRASPAYLGHIIRHHHHLMASWLHLDEAVLTGGPAAERSSAGEDEIREDFLLGMLDLAMLTAPRIVPLIDLSQRRRLLDLGGGPGIYSIQFCRRNPHLAAVVYDLPATRSLAEATIDRFGLSGRIVFAAGDFIRDEIPGRFDVAWLSHILHGEGPTGCARILDKVVSAVEPGGMVLIQEFILDDTREGPLQPALFSLNMLLVTPSGQAYTEGELAGMLSTVGVREIHRLPLDLLNGAGVIAGFVP